MQERNYNIRYGQVGRQYVLNFHGVPGVIFLPGEQFTSNFWQQLWKMTGIILKFSTSYHPQTQGVVERIDSVVIHTLHCIITESRMKHWEKLSATVELSITSSPNLSTGHTPFFLEL